MNLGTAMRRLSKKYAKIIDKLEKQIAKAPEGTLHCKKERGGYKWYCIDGTRKRTYLRKDQEELAASLAIKIIRQRRLEDLRKEKFAVDLYLKHHEFGPDKVHTFLETTNDEMRRLISKGYQTMEQRENAWQKAEYVTNPMYPEKKKIRTLRGDLVRSKSEAMIADYLFTHGIIYRYECELRLSDTVVYPDFLVLHPVTGELIIIEHFGMMDNDDYRNHCLEKLNLYTGNGYYPDINLLCFFETAENPLDSFTIADKIACFFGGE